jgi:hypothetical protein
MARGVPLLAAAALHRGEWGACEPARTPLASKRSGMARMA